jgi:PAS domain S-box-containing protein
MRERSKTLNNALSDETYRILFDLTPGALLVFDLDGRILDCNEDACMMFNYTKAEMLLQSAKDFFPSDICDFVPDMIVDSANAYIWLCCMKKDSLAFPARCKSRIITINGQKMVLFNVFDSEEICCDAYRLKEPEECIDEIPHGHSMTWKKEDEDYVLIGYDKAIEQFTQGRITKYIGKKAKELYKDQPEILNEFLLCEQKKPIIKRELSCHMFSTGDSKYMRVTIVFMNPDIAITYYEDMTNKKNLETLFRESEKRRLLASEAASDGVWDWNVQTGQIITCPAYFTMLGYGPSKSDILHPEVVTSYDEFINLVHIDDRDIVDRRLHEYIASKKRTYEMELRLKTKAGGWKWILKRGKVVEWDEQNNPVRMIGTHIDIHESRQAKDALKQSVERLKAQYIGLPVPTYTWQKNGNEFILSDFNLTADKFTDGQISGFIGKKAHILYKENPEILGNITRAFQNKTTCKDETLYCMFTTEEKKHIVYTCAYVAPDMVLVHMEDITKQKLAEDKLQRSEKDLRDLTAQLFKAEEKVRKYIAQELHDSIGQDLSSMKYISEKAMNQINAGQTDKGCCSLEKLVSIIQSTIDDVSRISMDLRPSTIDDLGIIATISWFCREYHLIYPDMDVIKKIRIKESDISSNIRIHLFRIIQESLNNVARHAKASRVKIGMIKTDGKIEISISDNGIGFDYRKKMLFNQENRRGFGLTSMKERTFYSGGRFIVESVIGQGTTIRASWPCAGGAIC